MDKTIINHVIDGISGIFQPIINLLSAAGLLKGTLAILTAADVLSASSETYLVLNAMADSLHTASIIREYRGDVVIDTPLHCNLGKNIFLGSHVIINMNCTFADDREITIGDRVLIASNIQIYTASHPVLPQERLIPEGTQEQALSSEHSRRLLRFRIMSGSAADVSSFRE